MNKIKLKINGYDEDSYSLLVSFASDTTKSQDPTEYPVLAYQPQNMWPGVTDISQLPKLIAAAGMWQAEQQTIKEQYSSDPEKQAALQAMVGQTFSFDVLDLVTPPITNEVVV